MWNWLVNLFKRKKKEVINPCSTCVWWAAEEENKVKKHKDEDIRFCDIHKLFTDSNISCYSYIKEEFEAKSDSIQTEEKFINHELIVDGSNTDGESK